MFSFMIIFIINIAYAENLIVTPLKNYQWRVHDLENEIDVPVTKIPTGIYTDLQAAEVFDNLLFRFNDKTLLSVTDRTWIYEVNFSITDDIQYSLNTEIVFHGLDGTGTIVLNGIDIGSVANTFVRYRFNVTKKLKGENNLKIIFNSPIQAALELSKKFPNNISNKKKHSRIQEHGHFLRRMAASFGYKWSPAVPSVGIWKEIELISYEKNDLIIRDIMTSFTLINQQWILNIKVNCEKPSKIQNDIQGIMEASLYAKNYKLIRIVKKEICIKNHSLQENFLINLRMIVPENEIQLWWPNGYGEQNLYDLKITFLNGTRDDNTKSIQIGFRTLELKQDLFLKGNFDKGLTFSFIVNDTPILARGANFLPTDILLENTSAEDNLYYLILSAKSAHMNMLRISAAGIYQPDYFYELCDIHGILVWQDMMFDNEKYPFDDEIFLSSVTMEITQQIMRLQHHPSLAVWVGNNEIEKTLISHSEEFKIDEYLKFVKIFKEAIVQYESGRPYLISTPSNGLKREHDLEGGTISPNDFLYGDVHRYFTGNSWITDTTNIPRFLSEFGVPSFPSIYSLREVAYEDDISSSYSDFFEHRQSSNTKNIMTEIICSISHHFGEPIFNVVENIIYASQINQAWALKLQVEMYRLHRKCHSHEKGCGELMGTLYWHLNDVWQAPTYSSIEYNGRWKMLHYYTQKFFAPIISYIAFNEDSFGTNRIQLIIISDLTYKITVKVNIEIFKWDMLHPILSYTTNEIIMNVISIEVVLLSGIIPNEYYKKICKLSNVVKDWNCLVKVSIIDLNNEEVIHTNFLLPVVTSFKDINLSDPTIQTSVIDCTPEECIIKVQTDFIALFVWLETRHIVGYFSDNGFIMTEEQVEIKFYPKYIINADQLRESLTVKVLSQTYLRNFKKPTLNFQLDTCKDY